MIEVKNLTKRYDDVTALKGIDLSVADGTVLGLIGTNGGGKSTLLRLLAGVLRPDDGTLTIDGKRPFNAPEVKSQCFFVPDFPYFYDDSTLKSAAALYRSIYPGWSDEEYERCLKAFPLDRKKRIINMSKGMQRQAALIIALATRPRYLFLDEIFDGLDAVMRLKLKKLLAERIADSGMTVIIASHTLRELDDLCDRVCLLHKGELLLERGLDELTGAYRRVQLGFAEAPENDGFLAELPVVSCRRSGNIYNLTLRGGEEDFMPIIQAISPAYISVTPLTLEDVFISEMEAAGYDAHDID